jgi:RNA polymerase sigma factor FliA
MQCLQLVEHAPTIQKLAKKIHRRLPPNVEVSDLFSAGMLGLLQASAKFKPAMGAQFGSYAHLRIRGAILDSLRDMDWAPRELRRKGRAIGETIQTLTLKLGRSPYSDEVAGALKISLSSYNTTVRDLNGLEIVTFDNSRDGEVSDVAVVDPQGRPEDDPLVQCIRKQRQKRLTTAIAGLSCRERLVTMLYYYNEMTMFEIGRRLGVVESRISHIHASAVGHLRTSLSDMSYRGGEKPLRPRKVGEKKVTYDSVSKSKGRTKAA